ncbi:type II toxin-antitoxin system ParD family antitoxin [Aurantimonas sp. 22II-16-19i]|uniref:type II toxin-antitoxin system ParD family antitoxin n=1 Tax=Aurantimonas sp. 22II-16-19i TaxID=1317114 RepID=UPI0009F7F6DE|nr:type II toxin-antitoxin system ParD family antitoxin [Aurantimonas sp. 22II-16-19i]ORE90281.1 putative CopG/Arc/MetJ family addiction module antidote protein [Aurantimonas sp. 22II-16-19i]
MSSIERMTITVPAEMAAAVKAAVREGGYASTSEVVREALREWTRSRDSERQELMALREAIRAGDASGASIPADEVYAELRAAIEARRAGSR